MKPSEDHSDWEAARNRIIGLGERSVHKNYYPALRRNTADLQKLMLAIEQTTTGLVICDLAEVIEFVNPAMCAMTGFSAGELVGATPRVFRSGATPPETYAEIWTQLNAGQPWRGNLLNRRKDGTLFWTRLSITPLRDEAGAISHFVGVNEDITERVQAEERQKLLVDELNHRVKNTLALAQAIAAQTLRTAESPQAFCQQFEARLHNLSQTHNLLNLTAWSGADLAKVLGAELAPYAGAETPRFVMAGDEVLLTPNSAVTLGMAFHELASNSAKYGAFSQPRGRIDVDWNRSSGSRLRLHWREQGGPPVQVPRRRGFGVSLLERGLAHQLGGRVELDFRPEGIRCLMDLPLERLEAQRG
ncbi:MAG TPA: HWE histidine kinase domain-containing protein [Magnetospirillum sp.]|nr:HWE histidine kinase domain-containing protein [Magnetospirillum sp.]